MAVPTHGDWQPRNWLIADDGLVRVIDLGRADWRPAETDLTRLSRQDFLRDGALERAFFDGYGADPRGGPLWRMIDTAEAIGTIEWGYRFEPSFGALGLRHLERLFPKD